VRSDSFEDLSVMLVVGLFGRRIDCQHTTKLSRTIEDT
jgi:hypothetical protein